MNWLESDVSKNWGQHGAARVWHIVTAGVDGEVQPANNRKPYELKLKSSSPVPGACAPATNLFHISQSLSWIAGTRTNLQERLQWIKEIPTLIQALEQRASD